MEKLHEEELSNRAQSGEVEPVVAGPILNVLSVLLDASK